MLLKAMDSFQLAKREYGEAKKAQYTDMTSKDGAKEYFRASELGSKDRKIMYGFFKHQIPTIARSAKSCRQLENGDYVHTRYQTAWEDMGALISMEERLTSKDDEYLKQYEWEWAGHYDGLLDLNVLRAHALGLCTISYHKNEELDKWEMEVEVDDAFATEVGLFNEDYVAPTMVADIKTMNPWGFKRIKEKEDVSEIQGYIDQISFYMCMLNTPYASIFIEDKGSNDTLEIQIVWKDLHQDIEYTFTPEIHGEAGVGILRLTIDNERFFGSDKVLGIVPRIQKLWETKKALEEADASNDTAKIALLMPQRCSEDPSKFPCSWGKGSDKCEFYDHCWNQLTEGNAVRPYVSCPEEDKWRIEIADVATSDTTGVVTVVEIDSRKVPAGVTQEAMQALMAIGAIDLTAFLVVDNTPIPVKEAMESAENGDHILDANGELNLGLVELPVDESNTTSATETLEYTNEGGNKAIKCLNCGKEVTYLRLGNGGTKKCTFCSHVNKVIKE